MMPVRRTQSWLPSIFNDFFDNDWMVKANATAPAINVLETEKEYKVELAAPGMTKDDFNVRIDEDNNLVISMEKKTENKEEKKDGRYLRREFSYSKFQQTMILPDAVSAYNLIVCRSFFESGIPVELLEAAKIDGCSDFGFFFKIAIPLSKTIIAVMCLFYATAMWNQFFNALMFLQDDSKMPLQVVLRNLVLMNQSNQMGSSASEMVTKQKLAEQLKYCVVVVSAFPLLCVYPFLQKYFAKGVTIGAVKG